MMAGFLLATDREASTHKPGAPGAAATSDAKRVMQGVKNYKPTADELAQAKAALAQARATSEQSVREENRLKPLAADQAISGKDYDDATSTRKTSAANVMAKEADVRRADLNLSYTKVIAPIRGRAWSILVKPVTPLRIYVTCRAACRCASRRPRCPKPLTSPLITVGGRRSTVGTLRGVTGRSAGPTVSMR